ncbi:MAG: hypothetical protein AAGG48_25305 [Planctomycetota bacterium]
MTHESYDNDGRGGSVAPTLQLSRTGLILSLFAMVLGGVSIYRMFPESVGGPPLPVEVELDEQPVVTTGNQGVVITEIVRVRNLADYEIPKLSIEINGQYLLFRESPLQANEVLELPQRVFTDKRSSQRFNPSKYDVEEIVVTGQLPSNARGVSTFEFE